MSFGMRKYNEAALAAELEGNDTFYGKPCTKEPAHIKEDGTTERDTASKCCIECRSMNPRHVQKHRAKRKETG